MKMRAFVEMILSLLAVVGLMTVCWLCLGRFLTPAGGEKSVTVLPGQGDGETLEQALRGLLWLRGAGLLESRVVIVDCGLTAEGRALAAALQAEEPSLDLCPVGELERYIQE